MNILALDTTTESCSVAVSVGGEVVDRSGVMPRRHAEEVLPMADAVLAEVGLTRKQLDGIAVGRGPGAFTGVRLGVSVAQGLAFGLGCPVVTVSSLAALAMDAADDDAAILAVIDARMGEVYAGAFRRVDGLVQALNDETVGKAEHVILPPADVWQVVGTGWGVYADTLRALLPASPVRAETERYPQARHVARLALPAFAAGDTLAPEEALPVYLRNNVAAKPGT